MPSFKGDVVFFRAMHPFLAVNKLTLDIEALIGKLKSICNVGKDYNRK
jgi:hypothetical protein